MKHLEFELQKSVCKYLNNQYPNVLFLSDTIANVKLNVRQGARNKTIQKAGFKTPDLIILQPNNLYHGLFIEFKTSSPFKKDGTILKNEHLEGQLKSIQDLNNRGYYAQFCWTFEMAKETIDKYLKQ